jgi:hypothetical protein
MLNSADHDSMSGEHVGTTSRLIVTSGKSWIWPLVALKIRHLESCKNSQGRERDLGKNIVLINNICEEAGHFLVYWKEELVCTCCYEH